MNISKSNLVLFLQLSVINDGANDCAGMQISTPTWANVGFRPMPYETIYNDLFTI